MIVRRFKWIAINMKTLNKGHIFQKLTLLCVVLLASCGKGKLTLEVNPEFVKREQIEVLERTVRASFDIASGSYQTNPTVTITLDGGAIIDHCLVEGDLTEDGCCDLDAIGETTSSGTLMKQIGTSEGKYCFSFQGRNIYGFKSQRHDLVFNVDSGIPDVIAQASKMVIQSTEEFQYTITSTEIGSNGLYYTLFNYGTDKITDCELMDDGAEFADHALSLDTDNIADTIHLFDFAGANISFSYSGKELLYGGNNTLYSLLIDSNPATNVFACPSVIVTLEDFPVFDFTSSGGLDINGQNEYNLFGGFTPFGQSIAGSDGQSNLELSIYNIVN